MIEIRTLTRRSEFVQNGHANVFQPDDEKLLIDFEQLERYISTRLTIKYKNNGTERFRNIPFQKCKVSDFTKRGLKIEKGKKPFEPNTICPNVEGFEDFWKVKNSYQNETERVSFNIE